MGEGEHEDEVIEVVRSARVLEGLRAALEQDVHTRLAHHLDTAGSERNHLPLRHTRDGRDGPPHLGLLEQGVLDLRYKGVDAEPFDTHIKLGDRGAGLDLLEVQAPNEGLGGARSAMHDGG